MKIVLGNSIGAVNTLLNMCPNSFSYVPLKFYKDDDGTNYASIETIDVNGDVVFSGKVQIDETGLEAGSGMVVKLPLNRTVINTIFGGKFTNVVIEKTHILASTESKKLSFALFQMNNNDVLEFPTNNKELLQMAVESNNLKSCSFAEISLNKETIKDFIDCANIISNIETLSVEVVGQNINVTGIDNAGGNSFEYTFSPVNIEADKDFTCKFDYNLIDVLSKVSKIANDNEVSCIFSEILAIFYIKNDNLEVSLAVTAQR